MMNNKRQANGVLVFILLAAVANSQAIAYTFTDLGPNVEPKDINNSGIVVGASNTDQYPATAFSWSLNGGFTILDGVSANAVNDEEQIAGITIDGAFITDVNPPEWSGYAAFGINRWGFVSGYQIGENPYRPSSLPYNPAIFNGDTQKWEVYDIARLYPRGTRDGVYADRFILNDITEDGIAVGYKYRYGLAGSSVILIDTNGTINDASDVDYLPVPNGGSASSIIAIKDTDDTIVNYHIVGTTGSNSSAGEYSFAFLYNYNVDQLINLGTLLVNEAEYGLTSSANDINDLSQVVGSSRLITALTSLNDPTKYHAFIWEPAADGSLETGTMTDLNNLVALPEGWILTHATANNDLGDIVGQAVKVLTDGTIEEHGFYLKNETAPEPPPEPNQPPVAVAGADPHSGKAPLTVQFDSTGSSDPEGSPLIYFWDFGDGGISSDANPSHVFSSAGTYQVNLTVTDDQSLQASDTVTIRVRKGKSK